MPGPQKGQTGEGGCSAAVCYETRSPGDLMRGAVQCGDDRHPTSPPPSVHGPVGSKLRCRRSIGQAAVRSPFGHVEGRADDGRRGRRRKAGFGRSGSRPESDVSTGRGVERPAAREPHAFAAVPRPGCGPPRSAMGESTRRTADTDRRQPHPSRANRPPHVLRLHGVAGAPGCGVGSGQRRGRGVDRCGGRRRRGTAGPGADSRHGRGSMRPVRNRRRRGAVMTSASRKS